MALTLGQIYGALRAGDVRADKALAAAEAVANYDGELSKLRTELSVRIGRAEADVRLAQVDDGLRARLPGPSFYLQLR
jgi:hypothetical protein